MQGSVDSPIISAVSIGNDVEDAISKSENDSGGEDEESDVEKTSVKVKYETTEISSLCFMDDIFHMSENARAAQEVNKILEDLIA